MINPQVLIINTPELFERLKAYADKISSELFFLDCETDSAIPKTTNLYGIGVCFNLSKGFYIVHRTSDGKKVWTNEQEKQIADWLKQQATKRKLIGHNLIFDVLVLENNLNVYLTDDIYCDTILLKHTLDEERPHGLKETAVKYLGDWANKAQDKLKQNVLAKGGKWKKEQKDMYLADTEILAEYCVWDVCLTHSLYELLNPRLAEEKMEDFFYKDEVMPLYKECTIPMKRRGFPVNVKFYEDLLKEITADINSFESEIMGAIDEDVRAFEQIMLDVECPVKPTKSFIEPYAALAGIPLPVNAKTGKITFAAGAITKQKEASPIHSQFYDWVLGVGEVALDKKLATAAQLEAFKRKNPDMTRPFNLNSNDHLGYLFVTLKGYRANVTPTGKAQINADFLKSVASQDEHAAMILDYKRLQKIKSTYIEGVLERHIDGVLYTDMLQFGTTSGRYSSQNMNLQNLPRIKDDDSGISERVLKYVNAIRHGLIAGPRRKVVNADFSQLEPCCYAAVSGDAKLQDIFKSGKDLYCQLAIDVFNLKQYSADKKSSNYLKNFEPELRQLMKVVALAVVYGAEAGRISGILKKTYQEAQAIINAYLNAYPGLKRYMANCENKAKKLGYVKNKFGRTRHLTEAKSIYTLYDDSILNRRWAEANKLSQLRYDYKTLLNNAKNFPIQSLAAGIVNRAMIAAARRFRELGLNAYISLQVHDEITVIADEAQAEQVKAILQDCMENTTKIEVPLKAEPLISDNWGDAK